MTTDTAAPQATMDTIRRAIEGRDAALLTTLYADDAEVRVVDHVHASGTPLVLRDKKDIVTFNDDLCGRAMTHRIEQEVVAADGIAFTEACQYPEGMNVLCATVMRLRDGLIARQTIVQAWDE